MSSTSSSSSSSSSTNSSTTARFAWLADVSDMVSAGEPEEDEGGGGWLDIIASGHLPVCAKTCDNAELLYRTLGAWSVPWSKVPLDRFLPAWFRLPARRRRALMRELHYFVDELGEEEMAVQHSQQQQRARSCCWVARMCMRDDVRMMRALAAVEPVRKENAVHGSPFIALQGGPLRRAVARRFDYSDVKHSWEKELVRLCVTNNAIQCMTAWAQSRGEGWQPTTVEVAPGLECVRLGRLAMLELLITECGCRIGYGKDYYQACREAAAAGQLECLRFLIEKKSYKWKKFCVWNAAHQGTYDGCVACARYLVQMGCPTERPPIQGGGGGGLMSLLTYGAQDIALAGIGGGGGLMNLIANGAQDIVL